MIRLEKRDQFFLGILFVLSLVIRVGVYHWYLSRDNRFWQVDSQTYHLVAQGIAQDKGISQPNGTPNFYRLPGYPVFLAFFYKIWGDDPYYVLWVQIFLAALIPLLIFLLALALFPRRRLLVYCAGLYSCFHIGLVLYSGFFMTESMFLLLLLLFFIFFLPHVHWWFCRDTQLQRLQEGCSCCPNAFAYLPEDSTDVPSFTFFYEQMQEAGHEQTCQVPSVDMNSKYMFLSGILLGLASLVRPVGHYLVVLSLLLLLFSYGPWRSKCKYMAIFFISWLVPVLPWLIRNYLLLGSVFFHTLPGGHFLYLSASRVVMQAQECSYIQARLALNREVTALIKQEEKQRGQPLNEIERCYAHEKIARHYFMRYPGITIKLWLTDMFRTCFSLYSAELLYLENDRPEFDYFSSKRTLWSLFQRYLIPKTNNLLLKIIIYAEMAMFLLMLLGFLLSLILLSLNMFGKAPAWYDICTLSKILPFMALFVVIALAGGYARMRLGVEPFLIIFGWYGWLAFFNKS